MRPLTHARTLLKLGLPSVARVATYRLLLRSGAYRRWLPIRPAVRGPFFAWPEPDAAPATGPDGVDSAAWTGDAERVMGGALPVFSNEWVETGFPPRWQRSVMSRVDAALDGLHWSRIGDFGLPGGDVKGYWEPARFEGLLILAAGWLCTRRDDMRSAIEHWLADWCRANPANAGIQWKCGQETSIRLMHLVLAAHLLERWADVRPTAGLHAVVAEHCNRIATTLLYAVGQDNNHGSSEAAALFVAGSYLATHADAAQRRRAARWRRAGRHWLENRVQRLVLPDGSFSQHSVNYHRMALDTFAFAETWRRLHGEAPFSERFRERCAAATIWLREFTDPATGDAPNLGANDGARLFVLHRRPYRDFRPSVQWASALFLGERAYARDDLDGAARWLGLDSRSLPQSPTAARSRLWPDGGYAKLAAGNDWLILRLPRYRFRPSHADALHLDLWTAGLNLLRDGGSYSYNTDEALLAYFSGTASHNTVQFDGRDQMPRLSRFLFGDWLDGGELNFDEQAGSITAGYRDAWGATHRRSVRLQPGHCRVIDEVTGFRERAVLRWRLPPPLADWQERTGGPGHARRWHGPTAAIEIRCSDTRVELRLAEGRESRHYGQIGAITTLEADVMSAASFTTDIIWRA